VSAELLRVLASSTFASTAAIVIVLILRKPMRRRVGASAAYALWALVPLAATAALLPAPVVKVGSSSIPLVAPILIPLQAAMAPVTPAFNPAPWLALLWSTGVLLALVWLIGQQRRFMRGLGALSEDADDALRAQATAGCPALVGVWRPRIVLPADFEQRYDAIERRLVLAHERMHSLRGDAQLNGFAAALRCVFWFNPLIHVAASRFRFDQELACDAAVIARFPEARRPYADAMLKTQLADIGLPAGCYWQSSHPLKERISMLKQPLPSRARRALGAAIAVALIGSGTWAAWAAQPPTPPPGKSAAADAKTPVDIACCAQEHATYRKLRRLAYPPAALAAKLEGVVYVKVHVGADGSPENVVADSVHPQSATTLAEASIAAVRTWTFNAASRNGKPFATDEIIPIAFILKSDTNMHLEGGTLDAIRVSPPDADAQASDIPASEDVSYRKSTPPAYPVDAIKAHQEGKIVLKVHVDEHGDPESASVFQAQPPEAEATFGNASITAVMHWKFNPALRANKAVAGDVLVPFTYSLTETD
jgi:TonB family protein